MAKGMLSSSIGKKLGMALTGLAIYGFLMGHLAGNLLLFKNDGGEAFNAYSEFLINHPLLIPMEIGLVAIFVLHIVLAISVSRENRRARPDGYATKSKAVGGRSFASYTMLYSGILILIFVLLHLYTFKYGDKAGGTLYDLVNATFQQTGYLVWYVFAMVVMGFHLWHAFQSAFQTLSLRSQTVRTVGLLLGVVIAGGFAVIPLVIGMG
jgi:succinate dehydrogenase / fumarate reductase cytochrome b subunit